MEKFYTVSKKKKNKKQNRELTVAQIMNSLLPKYFHSDLNGRKYGKELGHQVRPKSNLLWLYSGSDK